VGGEEEEENVRKHMEYNVKSYSARTETTFSVWESPNGQIGQIQVLGHAVVPSGQSREKEYLSTSEVSKSRHEDTLTCSSSGEDVLDRTASSDWMVKAYNGGVETSFSLSESPNGKIRDISIVGCATVDPGTCMDEAPENSSGNGKTTSSDYFGLSTDAGDDEDSLHLRGTPFHCLSGSPTRERSSSDSGSHIGSNFTSGTPPNNLDTGFIERLHNTLGGGLGLHHSEGSEKPRPLPPLPLNAPPGLFPVAGASSCPASPLVGAGRYRPQALPSEPRSRSMSGDSSLGRQLLLNSFRSDHSGSMLETPTSLWPRTPESFTPHPGFMLPPPVLPSGGLLMPPAATADPTSVPVGHESVVYVPMLISCCPHLCSHCGQECQPAHCAGAAR